MDLVFATDIYSPCMIEHWMRLQRPGGEPLPGCNGQQAGYHDDAFIVLTTASLRARLPTYTIQLELEGPMQAWPKSTC